MIFITTVIGLPGLREVKQCSELWRLKFHNWIDQQQRRHGFDLDAAEAAGEALRRVLEKILDSNARKACERFAELLRREKMEGHEEA